MREHANTFVLLGGLSLCGAACALAPAAPAAGAATLAVVAGSAVAGFAAQLAPNLAADLYSRFADWTGKRLRDRGKAAANHDLRDLMVMSIWHVLDGVIKERPGSSAGVAILKKWRDAVPERLEAAATDSRFRGVWEPTVPHYFKARLEEFAEARALTPDLWKQFLNEAGYAALGADERTALDEAAKALHEQLPRHLVGAYRDALAHHPTIYVAVQTAILQEIWAVVSRVDSKVDALRRKQEETLAAVRALGASIVAAHRAAFDELAREFTQPGGEFRVLGWTIEWLARDTHGKVSVLLPQAAADAKVAAQQSARAADNTDEIKAQVAEVKTITERTLAATGLTWAQVTLKPLSAALPAHHVERPELLADLHAKVAKGGSAGVRQAAAAHGDGGEGKTVLALAYAYEAMKGGFGEEYRYPGGVYLVHVGTDDPRLAPGRLKEALAELLQDLSGDAKLSLEQRAGLVKGKLSQAPASLLIIDNVMDEAQWSSPEFAAWLPGPACAVVATTRAESLGALAMQRVGELSFEQAREVLAGFRGDAREAANEEAVRAVHRELEGLALGVAAVGAYMSLEKEKTWAQEAAWLAAAPTDQFHDRAEAVRDRTGYPGKLRAVLDALRARLTAAERLALDFAAHLAPGNIPTGWLEDLVERCTRDDAGVLSVELGERPSGDAQTPAGVVQRLVDLGLLPLERDELKDVEPQKSAARRRAVVRSVHRLHARRAREEVSAAPGRERALFPAIAGHAAQRGGWLASAGEDHVERWIPAANRWEVAPLRALITPPAILGFDHADVADVLMSVAFVVRALGRPGEAAPLHREALAMHGRLILHDHPYLASTFNNLASVVGDPGRAGEAEPLCRETLAMTRRFFPGDHFMVAGSLNNLAFALQALGRAREAEPLCREALDMWRRLFPANHPNVAISLNSLAAVLQALGRAGEAEPIYREALEMRRRLFLGDHPDVATSLNNLGRVLESLGRVGEAEPVFREALAMYRRLFQGDHPHVATSLNNVAAALGAMGRAGEAEPIYREALAMRRRLFRGDHPDVATSLNNLAFVLQAMGRAGEAEPIFREALTMRRRLFPGDHPNVATNLNNLAAVLQALDRAAEAEPIYREALAMHRRLFQGDHPYMASSLNNLAFLLDALGRAAEAEPIYREALAMRRRLFKGDHPDVATGLNNLAALLFKRGEHGEARAPITEAAEMILRLFGPEHPTSKSILASRKDICGE